VRIAEYELGDGEKSE